MSAHEEHLATIPASARQIVRRALRRQGSPRNAIKAKCLDCCHYEREEVRNYAVWRCPLHPWRPYQGAPENADVSEITL